MVKESTYLKKSEEAAGLERDLASCRADLQRVAAERAALEKEKGDLSGLAQAQQSRIAGLEKIREQTLQEAKSSYTRVIEKLKAELQEGQVTITELQGRLTLNLLDSILFDSGKAEIKPEGRLVLQKVVEAIGRLEDRAIRIEGHTDNVKIGGALARAFSSNWELSAARAINVTRYLQRLGVDPAILSASAFGEYRPVSDNETSEGRAKNRRIEIILVPRD